MTRISPIPHCASDLEPLFDACFRADYSTILRGGATEPLYQPSEAPNGPSPAIPHVIHYREDYFRSALHEVAHWCVAGPERRRLVDFGYWYVPDGRNADQQSAFEAFEVQPQALELLFCAAIGEPFQVSVDNLGGDPTDPVPFEQAVGARARCLSRSLERLNARTRRWLQALSQHYRQTREFDPDWVEAVFPIRSLA